MKELIYIEEPNILFAHGQKCTDARDGLSLFGPLNQIYGINSGVIATQDGYNKFKSYLKQIQKPVYNSNNVTRPMFPGFEAAFNCKWESKNITFKQITDEEIGKFLYNESTHKRTYDLVTLFIGYSGHIVPLMAGEVVKLNFWTPQKYYRILKICVSKSATLHSRNWQQAKKTGC